jgi:hypothetical protein
MPLWSAIIQSVERTNNIEVHHTTHSPQTLKTHCSQRCNPHRTQHQYTNAPLRLKYTHIGLALKSHYRSTTTISEKRTTPSIVIIATSSSPQRVVWRLAFYSPKLGIRTNFHWFPYPYSIASLPEPLSLRLSFPLFSVSASLPYRFW